MPYTLLHQFINLFFYDLCILCLVEREKGGKEGKWRVEERRKEGRNLT